LQSLDEDPATEPVPYRLDIRSADVKNGVNFIQADEGSNREKKFR